MSLRIPRRTCLSVSPACPQASTPRTRLWALQRGEKAAIPASQEAQKVSLVKPASPCLPPFDLPGPERPLSCGGSADRVTCGLRIWGLRHGMVFIRGTHRAFGVPGFLSVITLGFGGRRIRKRGLSPASGSLRGGERARTANKSSGCVSGRRGGGEGAERGSSCLAEARESWQRRRLCAKPRQISPGRSWRRAWSVGQAVAGGVGRQEGRTRFQVLNGGGSKLKWKEEPRPECEGP